MSSNFDKLATKLASRPGVTNPRGRAAYIGRKKFSGSVMSQAAAKGVPAASIKKKRAY